MGTYNDVQVSKMYIDREPRFYNTVTFSGMKWHMSNQEIQFYRGGKDDNSVADGAPLTGYLLYKRMNRTVYGGNISGAVTSKYRPVIIFRLAGVLPALCRDAQRNGSGQQGRAEIRQHGAPACGRKIWRPSIPPSRVTRRCSARRSAARAASNWPPKDSAISTCDAG